MSSGLIRHESYGKFTYISPSVILKSYPSWPKKTFSAIDFVDTQTSPFVPWLPSINYRIQTFPKSPGKWLNFNFVHPNISGKVLSWRLPWPTCGRSPQGVHVDPENTDTIAIGWLKEQKGLKLEVAGKNMDPNDDERFKYFKIVFADNFPGSLIQRIHHILNHLRGWDQQLMSARSGRGFPFFWTCFSPELPGNRRIFPDKPCGRMSGWKLGSRVIGSIGYDPNIQTM